MQRTVHAFIRPGEESGFVAECPYLHAVTQGANLDEVVANLREVIALSLEGEDLAALGLDARPIIVVSFELEPAVAQASTPSSHFTPLAAATSAMASPRRWTPSSMSSIGT